MINIGNERKQPKAKQLFGSRRVGRWRLDGGTGRSQIHRLIYACCFVSGDLGEFLVTSKVLDARRRGATTESYEQYVARRSDRRQRRR